VGVGLEKGCCDEWHKLGEKIDDNIDEGHSDSSVVVMGVMIVIASFMWWLHFLINIIIIISVFSYL